MTPPTDQKTAQKGSEPPCKCHEVEAHSPATGTPFLQQLLLSVTVAVITSFMLEKVLGRKR